MHGQLFEALRQMVEQPELQPEAVRGVSRACESLCLWVHAVYQHACVQRHMGPQEALHAQLRARLAECRSQLRLLQLQEESARRLLRNTEKRLRAAEEEGEELKELLHQSESWERESAAAIRWLDPHIKAWSSAAEVGSPQCMFSHFYMREVFIIFHVIGNMFVRLWNYSSKM